METLNFLNTQQKNGQVNLEQINENTFALDVCHKDFIGVYQKVLSEQRCQEIIYEMDSHMKSNPSEIRNGKEQFPNGDVGRKDYSIFAQKYFKEISQDINKALDVCINAYGNEFFVLKNIGQIRSDEIKLQMTPPRGGYHVWHCEHGNKFTSDRVLAWTLYLNDVPEGEGETEFLWQGVRIQPKAGMLCIFPAAFTHTHRGNPVYSCDKYIATGWYEFNQ
jgi:hypothetical protein